MNIHELKDKMTHIGLSEEFEKLNPYIRNSIRLYHSVCIEEDLPTRITKIGGTPDLPLNIVWPTATWTRRESGILSMLGLSNKTKKVTEPYSFIAQINLEEVAPYDSEHLLPPTGILYFFCNEDSFEGVVKYFDGPLEQLKRAEFPTALPEKYRHNGCSVAVVNFASIPLSREELVDKIDIEDLDKIMTIMDLENTNHKLLGYADDIQGDMEIDCEMGDNAWSEIKKLSKSEQNQLMEKARNEWQLLLQVDNIPEIEMKFADTGRLYYWIRKTDLKARQFDKVKMVMQCY